MLLRYHCLPVQPLHSAVRWRQSRGRNCLLRRCAAEVEKGEVKTAKEAVEVGLVTLEKESNPEGAIVLFRRALQMNPTEKEASAAAYNIACCYVVLEEWEEAANQIVRAVNDYQLDIAIPNNDADLGALRKRPEWEEALTRMGGGMTTERRYDMISELRSPFRLIRFYIFGGLSIGAGAGLIFIVPKLIKSINAGDPIQEPLQNLAVNAAALTVFSFLFYRDFQAKEKQKTKILREETFGKLRVERRSGQSLPLTKLRGTFRPVIICGSKAFCRRSVDAARPYYAALRERGVAVIPIVMTEMDDQFKALKEDFQSSSSPTGFGTPQKTDDKRDRWELTAVNEKQWKEWLMEQKTASGLKERDFYLQVQLDGSIRASGAGTPPWSSIVSDLPPLDAIRTKLTDNIGF